MKNAKDARVLFICRRRNSPYGISIGLYNSAKFIANFLESKGIESKVIMVEDSNRIDAAVAAYKPTHVVIHAIWVPPEKMLELVELKRHKDVNWQVRIHSKVPFIAHEGMAFKWINGYNEIALKHKNFLISANSNEFELAVEKSTGIEIEYLPNLYMPDYDNPPINNKDKDFINIGCFGAIRPFKNHLLQSMAAMEFGNKKRKRIKFHINSDRSEQSGDQVLKNLRNVFDGSEHLLVEHAWSTHLDFLKIIATMNIGMQVSFSETYNIVAADFVYIGIPIVVSPEIEWMPSYAQVDPNNFECMVESLSFNYEKDGFIMRKYNQICLDMDSKKAGKIWLHFIERTI